MLQYILTKLFPKTINKIVADAVWEAGVLKDFDSVEDFYKAQEMERAYFEEQQIEYDKQVAIADAELYDQFIKDCFNEHPDDLYHEELDKP